MSRTYRGTSPERAAGLGPSHSRVGNDSIKGESSQEGADDRQGTSPRGDSCLDRHSCLLFVGFLLLACWVFASCLLRVVVEAI